MINKFEIEWFSRLCNGKALANQKSEINLGIFAYEF